MAGWLEDEIIYNDDLVGKETSLTVAIIGHGAANRCLYHYIMGFDESVIPRIGIDNCCMGNISIIVIIRHTEIVQSINICLQATAALVPDGGCSISFGVGSRSQTAIIVIGL